MTRRPRLNERGMAFILGILLLLFLFPIVTTLMNRAMVHNRHNMQERQIKTARILANNALMDIMREFSQNYYDDHFDSSFLNRSAAFYDVGFSTVTITPDRDNKTLLIRAAGNFGADPTHPASTKKVTALIRFVSDVLRFSNFVPTSYSSGGNNVTWTGGFYCDGDFTVVGDNHDFAGAGGDTVIIRGAFTGNTDTSAANRTEVDGPELYHGGVRTDIYDKATGLNTSAKFHQQTVVMPKITVSPQLFIPRANMYETTFQDLIFDATGGTQRLWANGVEKVDFQTATDGYIIVVENANVNVRVSQATGLKGRVTIVCTGSGNNAGAVRVIGNVRYFESVGTTTTSATTDSSFAVLASSSIYAFSNSSTTMALNNQDLTLCGLYYVDPPRPAIPCGFSVYGAAAGGDFFLSGTRAHVNIGRLSGAAPTTSNSGFLNTFSIRADPNLQKYPPPGLPERPVLVMWRVDE